jgi:hypothetical protein
MLEDFFNRIFGKRQEPAKTEQAIDPINTELQKIIDSNQEKSENIIKLASPIIMEYLNAKNTGIPRIEKYWNTF